ncbi:site-specific integrase [Burkholderia glumae]|uniref:site-specific integrase n=1 Tax=Burkholderia glumae TaxID=337 RepID=UPI003B9CF31B
MIANDRVSSAVGLPYHGTLPGIAKARGGSLFKPNDDLWEVREGTHKLKLHFYELPELEPAFKSAFKAALLWYAQNRSVRHLGNMFYRSKGLLLFKRDASCEPISEISDIDLLSYKSAVGEHREWYLGALSGFLQQWARLGLTGISTSAVVLLRQLRLKGNEKGAATATMDPLDGPFSALELEALQTALNDAYARRDVSMEAYVLCWLLMMLGQRSTQYAALKVRDVVVVHQKDGSTTHSLQMPRAKRRDSDARGEFKDRVLTPEIGALVARHAHEVQTRFTGLLDDPLDAPLFPGEKVDGAIAGFEYHQTSGQIRGKINSAMSALKVMSERTGDIIHIGPKRFRQTVGTRAAEEGHGELVIAELLDHSDTQNVGVYVRSTPAIVERIDRAVAMQLAPLAQAFAGKLINGPSEATRNDDPASQIRAPAVTGKFEAMSSCGNHGFCGFLKPVACYTCNSFEPWLDGPHEKVLEYLIAERERLMAAGDERIASINDRAILAVAEVVQLCEAARDERGAAND